MSSHLEDRTLSLGLPGHYRAPDGVAFVNLVVLAGGEKVHIRFSRGPNILLDLPLSAESLEQLIQLLGPLHGIPQQLLPPELETLRKQGAVLER